MTEETIFAEALARTSPADRTAYLAEACGGNAELRRRVEALLASHEQVEFLARPILEQGSTTLEGGPPGPDDPAPPTDAEAPGAHIGRYRLLQEIGHGGFGTVWMAEQREPVKRKVALKIIKLGMDTRQVIARFEAERQALAMMDHPNIARVLDAGATETGRPFFVMELVRGVPITEYCDTNNVPTAARLALFVKVCHAIQHAHQKGIIHRDIKPSNVLVTLHDGAPVPKVIDFGIAKATNAELTERTLFTEFRQMIGTPAYMSPEQAEMSGLDIDTRSDIYSLGVLLYELLTGTTPFDAGDLMRRGLGEIQRIIREEEPPRPSTRVSTLGEQLMTNVARHRGTEPRKLSTLIRGDLDWIVMKALEKDRTRRYETANGLAQDVVRHMQDEPVVARPAGTGYRLRKFVRRHRAGAAAVGTVALVMVLGIVGTTTGMFRARSARATAELARKDADAQKTVALNLLDDVKRAKDRADAANAFMRNMFAAARGGDPSSKAGPRGADVKVVDVLKQAADALDRLHDQPELELDGRLNLAKTYEALALMSDAEVNYDRARTLSRELTGDESEQTLQITIDLIFVMSGGRGRPGAEVLARQTAQTVERRFGPVHPLTFDAINSLAITLRGIGQRDVARELLTDLVNRARAHREVTHPKGAGRYFANLAMVLREQGRDADANAAAREAVAVAAAEPQTDPRRSISYRRDLVDPLRQEDKLEEAAAALKALTADARAALGATHPTTLLCTQQLCEVYEQLARWDEVVALRTELLAAVTPGEGKANVATLESRFARAEASFRAGRTQEARAASDAVVAELGALAQRDPDLGETFRHHWALNQIVVDPVLDRPWSSPGLRACFDVTAWDGITKLAWGDPPPRIRWKDLTFRLARWARSNDPEDERVKPDTIAPIRAQGGLQELAAAADPGPGVYMLSLTVPRDNAFPVRCGQWILLADWDFTFYRSRGPLKLDGDWEALRKTPPVERRQLRTIAHWRLGLLGSGFGPARRITGWAGIAEATVQPPAGRYRLDVVHDGLCRAWLDDVKVYDAGAESPTSPLLEFDGTPRRLRVEAANCADFLLVRLAPAHHLAIPIADAARPWPYDANVELERVDALIAAGPKDAMRHYARAAQLARTGQFDAARKAYETALALNPATLYDCYQYAILLAHLGDLDAYRKHCRDMLRRFGQVPDPLAGELLPKLFSILPLERSGFTAAEVEAVEPIAERALAVGNYTSWFKLARGIHHYRSGYHFGTGWLVEAEAELRGTPHAAATCGFFRAMMLWTNGLPDEARRARDQAEKLVREHDLLTLENQDLAARGFHDRLILLLARQEIADVFAKHPEGWRFESQEGGDGQIRTADGGVVALTATQVTGTDWHVQGIRPNLTLEDGHSYAVKFTARADADRVVKLHTQVDQDDWHGAGLSEEVKLTTEWKPFELTFKASKTAAGPHNRLGIFIGQQKGSVWIKDLTVTPK